MYLSIHIFSIVAYVNQFLHFIHVRCQIVSLVALNMPIFIKEIWCARRDSNSRLIRYERTVLPLNYKRIIWSGLLDSNQRFPVPKTGGLTRLSQAPIGTGGEIRTRSANALVLETSLPLRL